MINLCYVINVARNQGPCNVIYNLAATLPREKYKIHLVTLYQGNDSDTVSKFQKQEVIVKAFNYENRISCLFHVKHDLTEYCKENHIDIIHSNTLFSDLSASMIKNVNKKATIHSRTFEDYRYIFGAFFGSVIARIHMDILKKFDTCICCSNSVLEEHKKYLNNILAVRNGVCMPALKKKLTKNDLQLSNEACVFIFVGRISKGKNLVKLIELFVKNRRDNDYFLILGEGEEIEACRSVSDSHIKFLGFVDNPGDYYAIGDVYLSASFTEGLSLSQLESMSFGLKQLVSDIPSHREVVEVDPAIGQTFSEENFSDAFKRVTNDINLETKKKIQELFAKHFSANTMAKGYDEIYSLPGEKQ